MSDSEPETNWWSELDRNRLEPKFKFKKKLFELMVQEVFLPRKVPDSYDATKVYEHETRLLALMADIIQELNNELPQTTHNLFQTWSFLQCRPNLEAVEILNAIASLQGGDMFALYIRKQNCGFCLYIPSEDGKKDKAIVSTFPASIRNEQIMSNMNDLQMSFPSISVAIPFDNFVKSISFAEQLVSLDQNQYDKAMPKAKKGGVQVTEIRDVANPMYVSKWLMAFLANRNSSVVTGKDFPKVIKKIRDDVVYKGGDLPFRRSGLWMTMKAVLRLNLEKELNTDAGHCTYKIIQIYFASKMCEMWLRNECRTIDRGLATQMLAKVGRKIDKLSTRWQASVRELLCSSLYSLVVSYAKDTINKVREKLNDQFRKLDRLDRDGAQLTPLNDMNFQSDIIHKIPSLSGYIATRLNMINSPPNMKHFSEPQQIPRHRINVQKIPNFKLTGFTNEVDLCLLLADIEIWVRENLCKCTAANVLNLRDLAINYGVAAKEHYRNDPLGASRMILTILQIIRRLDQFATDKYSLLEEHHSGVNPRIIEDLLLPSRDQLEVASDLETYFEERNYSSPFPALNAEDAVSDQSFSVRFAETNTEMEDLRNTILESEEKCIEEKMDQVNRARINIQKWREEAKSLNHEFSQYWATYEFRSKHDSDCKLCMLTNKYQKYSIRIYERSIRREVNCQRAVVFELLIPIEISCLRDTLQFAADEFFFSNTSTNKLNVIGDWIDYEQITFHKNELDRRVHLGSTRLLYMNSHYSKRIHPDCDDSEFIVNNAYNCVYYGPNDIELSNKIEKQTVKRFCTFRVESNSPYESLQWTLSSTNHSQNEVLASQSDCPIELTLPEFIAFGSLRSDGHRLQMRNIYRALATETLSFEKESVAMLVLQSLWQAGPRSEDGWIRESHEDLADVVFASQTLELLFDYLTSQQNNWKHPLKVMVAVLIAVRILEINDDDDALVATAVKVLLYSRSVCDDWMTRIQKAKSECDCTELNQIQNLRANVVDVGICCALTFYASPKLKAFPQLWQSSTTISALSYWLRATVNVNNNLVLSTVGKSEFSNFRRTFLREMRIIGINSETLLLDQITKGFSTDMNRFATNQWPGVRNGMFKQWKSIPVAQQVVQTELTARDDKGQTNHIQMDVILGTFLVNGLPISSLPEVVTNDPTFKRVFGATSFDVQPTKNGKFCTCFKYNDCSYYFKMERKQLIVTEERNNGDVYELIPNEKFDEDIPFVLQNGFSHWWNRKKQTVEFRPVEFNVHNFTSYDQVQFELNLKAKLLTELKTSRNVIDRLSGSFMKMTKYLHRLESEKYIVAIMDGPSKISIELPRMRIHFILDESNEIMSYEYTGMQISHEQKFGTFIGLQNGLLLENKENGGKMIIMPHGKIEMKSSHSAHPDVWIASGTLRDPPFLIYDIDNRCQQLKARGSFSAWFYLAHLHAVTSHTLPDPFTGMRGTEKALQILQSAFCWSSEPYGTESITTLQAIRQLSPNRSFHPPHQRVMQKMQLPHYLPLSSSHEAYAIVVNRLICDSERLNFLHFKEKSIDPDFDMFLNERSYRRYVCYDPNAAVSQYFIKDADDSDDLHCDAKSDSVSDSGCQNEDDTSEDEENESEENTSDDGSEYSRSEGQNSTCSTMQIRKEIHDQENDTEDNWDCHVKIMRILAAFGHEHKFHVPTDCANVLNCLLLSEENLNGLSDNITGSELISEMNKSSGSARDVWLELYDIACNQKFDEVKFTLALTLLALNGSNLYDLLTLQVVAANPMKFRRIKPPNVKLFQNVMQDDFNESTISQVILSCCMTKESYLSQFEELLKKSLEIERISLVLKYSLEWEKKIKSQSHAVIALLKKQWPCIECDISAINTPQIYKDQLLDKIIPLFKMWYENKQLKLFLAQVSEAMQKLSGQSTKIETLKKFTYSVCREYTQPKYKIDFANKIAQNFYENVRASEIKSTIRLFEKGETKDEDDVNEWWERIKDLSIPIDEYYLNAANIYPRLVPTLIFPQMFSSKNQIHRKMIGALGVLFSLDQRAARLKKLEQQQPHMEVALRREKEEKPFSNWSPSDCPQWLLFEIEMNLTIRRIQVEVAENMIKPPGEVDSVMQLNMGEGKTAVIVPLLCATLSNKEHVCQVTVLKSLFKSNLKSLRQCLGGMLNHRVYTFPCRRDMIIGEKEAQILLESYDECLELNGVVLTLPEYRLSLQLKMYETSRKEEFEIASSLLELHQWLNKNVRNILDESDAILNAKYQLIYTVGEQLPLDGGELRWLIIQNILKIIPSNMKKLWNKYGNEKIEFDQHFDSDEWPEKFCACRILHPSVYEKLQKNIANDFIEERTRIQFPKLKTSEKALIKAVLSNRKVDASTYDECMKIFEDYPVYQDVIFILSGLLKFEVLHLVFKKRWRVNYGINPNGYRKMAVPYIAKDVCAENTEFGHVDVAICFTYLSYYYSGLSDAQLLNCFDILSKLSNSDEKYKEWIDVIPKSRIDSSIRTYSGINLSDSTQRQMLFTLLRFNMNVIDFWLANVVFPREARLFDGKMMCTAWDLCSEEITNVVTGFSGTNDTKLLLPKSICQNDLKELEDTNENVRKTIIREDNNYDHLESNISGVEILKKLVEYKIPVLLDSGALMLELNNEQVAKQWLKLVPIDQFDAAVYFDDNNLRMVVDRQNCLREFDFSPYSDRLDRCVIYLDDAHTRGTDIKFPSGIKACVTLCGGITRDKTVQACMRMRLLGQGHTICFWASEEADNGIRELSKKSKTELISTKDVFNWICHNSRVFEKDGLVHWSAAAYNYSQKIAAYRFIPENASDDDLKELSTRCTDREIIKLSDLYGGKNELSISSIFEYRFSMLIEKYNDDPEIKFYLSSNSDFVINRLKKYIPDVKRYCQLLDEEQEKELEYELEEQRDVQRPGKAHAVKPVLNKDLEDFLRHGAKNRKCLNDLISDEVIFNLPTALERTHLWSMSKNNKKKWRNDIYVTNDFIKVVQSQVDKTDEFLRPIWWIVSAKTSEQATKQVLLLMSPFEVNNFLPIFREMSMTTLRMYSPRISADSNTTMMNCKELQLPFNPRTSDIDGLVESQLSVFAGTTYFENKLEMENYCTFLGIIPSPFAKEYQKAFDKGQISLNGFVPPKHRSICEKVKSGCPFEKNPDKLVCSIIERRHGFFPRNSHVSKIVIEGTVAGIKYGEQ